MSNERVVAVGLLTQEQLDRYGPALKMVFPIHDTACFTELLRLIDEADQEHWTREDRLAALQRFRSRNTPG